MSESANVHVGWVKSKLVLKSLLFCDYYLMNTARVATPLGSLPTTCKKHYSQIGNRFVKFCTKNVSLPPPIVEIKRAFSLLYSCPRSRAGEVSRR